MVVVYFGYIARMTRAGTIAALDADYTRTAVMKGLPTRHVTRRHVMRNALQPTVSVIGTQIGYVFSGLIALELIFNYPGLGRLIYNAATSKDFPLLSAGVILVGIIYMLCTLVADLDHRLDEPARPPRPRQDMSVPHEHARAAARDRDVPPRRSRCEAAAARRRRRRRGSAPVTTRSTCGPSAKLARSERRRLLLRRPASSSAR